MKLYGLLVVCSMMPLTLAAQGPSIADDGHDLFLQKCAFCHGRDAQGGETGPDLTRSDLVKTDVKGDKIGVVIRNGRPEKGMPKFALPDTDIAALVAFIHRQTRMAESRGGGRKGVDASDLQTGNVQAGKAYFEGPGGCTQCHSVTGDLEHVATRLKPLRLEMQMLYPRNAKATASVETPGGQKIEGELVYYDEFMIGIRDAAGSYHSWPLKTVKAQIKEPAQAHEALLAKYSDDDIHNLMAYLQTLR